MWSIRSNIDWPALDYDQRSFVIFCIMGRNQGILSFRACLLTTCASCLSKMTFMPRYSTVRILACPTIVVWGCFARYGWLRHKMPVVKFWLHRIGYTWNMIYDQGSVVLLLGFRRFVMARIGFDRLSAAAEVLFLAWMKKSWWYGSIGTSWLWRPCRLNNSQ